MAVRVLLIAGLGHSGSTLLGALLGQLDGFFFVGELKSTARAFEGGQRCGCGEPLSECPTWRGILAAAFGDRGSVSELQFDNSSARALGILRQHRSGTHPCAGAFAAVFRAIAETTGSRVVVDSSKWPGYAYFLGGLENADLALVHLVRDPRGVAHSRRKHTARLGEPGLGPARSAMQWNVWNPVVEALGRRVAYLRLRYEDFVNAPEDAVRKIAALVGEAPLRLPFTAIGEARLEPTHSVTGNRTRFDTGTVPIELDDGWRREGASNGAVGALTWPLRLRYGYRTRP